jgi:hypothetical protein
MHSGCIQEAANYKKRIETLVNASFKKIREILEGKIYLQNSAQSLPKKKNSNVNLPSKFC